jgi:hypothetical protein
LRRKENELKSEFVRAVVCGKKEKEVKFGIDRASSRAL